MPQHKTLAVCCSVLQGDAVCCREYVSTLRKAPLLLSLSTILYNFSKSPTKGVKTPWHQRLPNVCDVTYSYTWHDALDFHVRFDLSFCRTSNVVVARQILLVLHATCKDTPYYSPSSTHETECVYMHIYIYRYKYIYKIYLSIHIRVYICVCVCVCICMSVYIFTYIYMYKYIYIYTYIYAYVHMYKYI